MTLLTKAPLAALSNVDRGEAATLPYEASRPGTWLGARSEQSADGSPEISIVMPCLNEADTVGACIAKAQQALRDHQIDGEVIIADNGSTDSSQAIAQAMGARVVP